MTVLMGFIAACFAIAHSRFSYRAKFWGFVVMTLLSYTVEAFK